MPGGSSFISASGVWVSGVRIGGAPLAHHRDFYRELADGAEVGLCVAIAVGRRRLCRRRRLTTLLRRLLVLPQQRGDDGGAVASVPPPAPQGTITVTGRAV